MVLDQKAVSPDAEVYSLIVYGVSPPINPWKARPFSSDD